MANKGMSQTLYIIIAAVVILVTALVILTVFSGSFVPIVGISNAKAQCSAAAKSSCDLTNSIPPTWTAKVYKTSASGDFQSCDDICSVSGTASCTNLGTC